MFVRCVYSPLIDLIHSGILAFAGSPDLPLLMDEKVMNLK
jgi:hypothetical protein